MSEANRLFDLLLTVNDLLQRDMASNLGPAGLSQARMHVLWVVHGQGPVTQQVLAETLRVTPRNVTGLVDALTESGYVTRQPHPSDRRATLVTLTEFGTSTMERTEREYHDLSTDLYGAVAETDRPALIRGLAATVERLSALIETDAPGSHANSRANSVANSAATANEARAIDASGSGSSRREGEGEGEGARIAAAHAANTPPRAAGS